MKRLFSWGLVTIAALLFVVSCSNPLLGSDGKAITVTNLVAAAGVGEATLKWEEPDAEFAKVEITYSASGVNAVKKIIKEDVKEATFENLTIGKEYTFTVSLVTITGVVAETGSTVTVTPVNPPAVFVAPHDIEVIGAGTPGGWDGNIAMTEIGTTGNEYKYVFIATEALSIKIRKLGDWGTDWGINSVDITDGKPFDLLGGNNIGFEAKKGDLVAVTFWWKGKSGVSTAQAQISIID